MLSFLRDLISSLSISNSILQLPIKYHISGSSFQSEIKWIQMQMQVQIRIQTKVCCKMIVKFVNDANCSAYQLFCGCPASSFRLA